MAEVRLYRAQRRLKRGATGVFHEAGTTLILPLELDEDMGQPEVITITVEPRDALNPCDCSCHGTVQPGLVPCPHCGDGMACL